MAKYNIEKFKKELEKNPLLENTVEIENTFLGGLLLSDFKEIAKVLPKVKPTDFCDKLNAAWYEGVIDFFSKNTPIEGISLLDYVAKHSEIKFSLEVLTKKLSEYYDLASTFNLITLAENIVERANKRRLYDASKKMEELANDITVSSQDALELADELLKGATIATTKNDISSLRELALDALKEFDKINNEGILKSGYKTGFDEFDYMLNGLNPSDLIIIAGRPAMGKTAFALNLLTGFAKHNPDKKALIFSLEMGKEQLFTRLLSMESEVSNNILRQGILDDQNTLKMGMGISQLGGYNIKIVNEAQLTPTKLRTIANLEKRLYGLDFIVVDYLQLMFCNEKSQNKQQEVSEISRQLKLIARELNIPVIALSQLSRSLESRVDKRPMLSDLRESGAIEQDADIVIFLYRDEYYNPDSQDQGIAEVIIGKHRNGALGTIKLKFIPEYTKFKNILYDNTEVGVIKNDI